MDERERTILDYFFVGLGIIMALAIVGLLVSCAASQEEVLSDMDGSGLEGVACKTLNLVDEGGYITKVLRCVDPVAGTLIYLWNGYEKGGLGVLSLTTSLRWPARDKLLEGK